MNLLGDIMPSAAPTPDLSDSTIAAPTPISIAEKPSQDFSLYHRPRLITNFQSDTLSSSLPKFSDKLYTLRSGQPIKIRIAYFGDSMIEGDLLTQTLRELLQKAFGGNGVGFVPITSQVSQFRQTVRASYSETWEEENFKEGKTTGLFPAIYFAAIMPGYNLLIKPSVIR